MRSSTPKSVLFSPSGVATSARFDRDLATRPLLTAAFATHRRRYAWTFRTDASTEGCDFRMLTHTSCARSSAYCLLRQKNKAHPYTSLTLSMSSWRDFSSSSARDWSVNGHHPGS